MARATTTAKVTSVNEALFFFFFFLVEEAYTQQGRAHIRRLHPDWAAGPAVVTPQEKRKRSFPHSLFQSKG
jgi:hypothetical protein